MFVALVSLLTFIMLLRRHTVNYIGVFTMRRSTFARTIERFINFPITFANIIKNIFIKDFSGK